MKFKAGDFLVIILIFTLSAVIRFYKLDDFRCLNWDEASFGYNAYSILQTGKDEYGTSLPMEFKSVGDYKYPFYVYSLVPIIKLWGLSEFSVRFFPSLLGSIAPIFLYFITRKLLQKRVIAFFSALALAISPWHIQFTRAGTEGGIAYTITLAGIYLLLKAVIEKRGSFVLPAIIFFLSLYTYFGERVFIPLILLTTVFVFKKEIIAKGRKLAKTAILTLFLLVPILLSVVSIGQGEKFAKTTIFGYRRPDEYVFELKAQGDSNPTVNIFHSATLENGLSFINHFLNHFSPDFLFVKGPTEDGRQYIWGMGMLYLTDIVLIIFGAAFLYKSKISTKYKKFILFWILVSPITSAITRDPVHARRALALTAPLSIITGAGMYYLILIIGKLKNSFIKILLASVFAASFIYFVAFYFASYYVFTSKRTAVGPSGWQCGYEEVVTATQKYKGSFNKIIIDTSYQGPYIFYLFYEKYPPQKYQRQARLLGNRSDTLGEGGGYDNYEFRAIYWPEDRYLTKTLFIGPPERLPEKDIKSEESQILEKVYPYNNGFLFHIVETF
ncbi:hypothetical protein A3D84_05565 [Candidatus Woesebacteria bacterium RIFCSPHIGHO2_02_FULL_42_20]|uniref:Glycosyltransferase RgtA/B/C/D-like domain-containing protein n=1 Tax=Candidatus Woesebacteria bacterium RIFCSPHIGHO2_12_FULL_41_24 TaxID=1802510 RepID=A0A1F8AR79_9BACT|nr:MAG: hypothetical protein A2873_00230 [Candidatus Woesebacteria bacterium RIFCSPHIGHO2_01_FULL_42_80]OGM35511.1 MAG: hypothetical protein A3D84_05565 [Candidatus Woesebacteria bacterium RIFCSPHIGHO2_02_FULL_42_20]OGM54274.1 MAG: hypothetical protein A3E44_01955 [Candidatus Woesebacteria bacterium RIFCSPHIGHO2_12_FULL_41_24]OGM66291.1 MAG: hypothetical protein A2969_01715 [Candidatus Woesebacteria bacterium RIFCSPLOWO2_01_FULL_42_67]OGM70566.1 MAG: hypothetical protein A3I55_02250 [Candidatus